MRRGRFLALLLLAGTAAYGPALLSAPVDLRFVAKNPAVSDAGVLLARFLHPVPDTSGRGDRPTYAWRPVSEATLFATGSTALGLRLGSLALHLSAAVLAYLLVRRLAGEDAARWASLFLAVHPLGIQALTYAYQRYVLVEAALAFACMLLYASGRTRWAFLAGLLAMGAKETAVTLPLALGVLELSRPGGSWRRWLPFAALPLLPAVQVWRSHTTHLAPAGAEGLTEPNGLTSLGYLRIQLPLIVRYAFLNAWPFPMRFHYDRPDPASIPLMKGLACAVLLVGGLWMLRRRRLGLAFGLWLAPLLLESTVFPIKHVGWNHRCYPGLLGAGLAFGLLASRLPRALPAVGILLLGALTVAETRVWADPDGLGRRDVRTAPRVPYLWGSEGMRALEEGRPASADRMFRQCLRPGWKAVGGEEDPRFRDCLARAHNNLGLEAYRRGDLAGAEACFVKALGLKPEYPLAERNLEAVRRRGE